MQNYVIRAVVPLDKLGEAVSALAGIAATAPDIEKVTEAERDQPKLRRRRKAADTPASETRSGKAVLNGMGLSDHSTYDIGRILEAAGLTASSASSVASALAREGKLERQGRGTYRKAGNYDPPASGLAA
jgi:hypothetical protein